MKNRLNHGVTLHDVIGPPSLLLLFGIPVLIVIVAGVIIGVTIVLIRKANQKTRARLAAEQAEKIAAQKGPGDGIGQA